MFGDATSNYGTNSVGGGPTGVATATGTHTAFMSEWGITGVVQITPHLSGRVGYQGLLLDGVALASQQIGALESRDGGGHHGKHRHADLSRRSRRPGILLVRGVSRTVLPPAITGISCAGACGPAQEFSPSRGE